MGSISGLPTAGDGFAATLRQGTIRGRVGFVEYGGRVFQLIGYTLEDRWVDYETPIRRALASFDRLTDPVALEAEPMRLHVVQVSRSMSLEEFARQQDATVPVDELALINRLEPDARLVAGRSYKVVTGGQLP